MKEKISYLKKVDPVLGLLIKTLGKIEFKKENNLFCSLIKSIMYQQLSMKAASTIFSRFVGIYKKFPTPIQILRTPNNKLRKVGLSKQKISYIKDLSKKLIKKELILENLEKLKDEEVTNNLLKVRGIGMWTSEMFLIFSLNREDIFPVHDLGIKKAIQKIYDLKNLPSIKELEAISQKWIPYRTIASLYLWRSLDQVEYL